MARALVVLDTIQEVRDLPETLRRQVAILVPAASKLYIYYPSSLAVDDGETWLKPTDTDCPCCKGRGRWKGSDLGGSGGGDTIVTNELVVEGARAISTGDQGPFDETGADVALDTIKSNDNGVADDVVADGVLVAQTDGPFAIFGRVRWKAGSDGTYHRLELINVDTGEVLDSDEPNDFVSNSRQRVNKVGDNVFLLSGDRVKLKAYTDATDDGATIEYASLSMYYQGGGGVASSAVGNPTGPAGRDLALTYPDPEVVGLQGDPLPDPSVADGFLKLTEAGDGWEELTPLQLAALFKLGGRAAIKLDDFDQPDDNTDLDVSLAAHGLAPKSPGWKFSKLDGLGGYSPASCDDITLKTVTEGCNAVNRYVVPALYTVSIFGSATFVTAGGRKYQDIFGHFNAPGRTAPASALWDFDTFADFLVDFRTGPNSGDLTDVRQWIAIATDVSANLYTLDDPSSNYVVGFRFSNSTSYSQPGSDTHFMAYCSDGSASTVVDTGITPALDTTYELYIDRNTPGHCKFYIDRVLVADITTNIPVTQTAFHYLSIVNSTLTDRHFRMGRMQVRYH